jgi:hypothetical protein
MEGLWQHIVASNRVADAYRGFPALPPGPAVMAWRSNTVQAWRPVGPDPFERPRWAGGTPYHGAITRQNKRWGDR